MEERKACALLKQRFEAAGYHIEENQPFDEEGVRFELDGFDAEARVGYEYISDEAGDSWDVDDGVKAALEARRKKGELHILFVEESEDPGEKADAFLAALKKPAKKKAAAKKEPAPKKEPAVKAVPKPKSPAKKKVT
jgi:hypothetical protein